MKILYIEDDMESIEMVKIILKKYYAVDYETDGKKGLVKALMNYYDLIIIDINLPGKNGLEICRELRNNKNTTPVIFLTSNTEKETLLNSFRIGGDDYIEKPFDKEELILRIEAILRRPKNSFLKEKIKCGDFYLNTELKKLFFKEYLILLTKKEYNILELFFRNQNKIFSRYEIFDKVWDINDNPLSNTVEVFIKNIRKKINKYTKKRLIKSVRCVGYYIGDVD